MRKKIKTFKIKILIPYRIFIVNIMVNIMMKLYNNIYTIDINGFHLEYKKYQHFNKASSL